MPEVNRPELCIVSLYNYPLFNPECRGVFGGGEVRTALIARELAKRGQFEISMVVFDHGQPRVEHREGITFYAHPDYKAKLPTSLAGANNNEATSTTSILSLPRHLFSRVFRRFHRLPSPFYGWVRWLYHWLRMITLSVAFRSAGRIGLYVIEPAKIAIYEYINADIYMFPGHSYVAAELAFYCRRWGKKYVFLAGSDHDYSPTFKERLAANDQTARPWVFAIEQAATHIAQNEHQAELLQRHYGQTAAIIRNPLDLQSMFSKSKDPQTILWVGRSDLIKRPKLILELARRCPQFKFTIIMTLWEQDIFDHCVAQAQSLPNVTLLTYVPYHDVEQYFAQAKLFVNTSTFEGFPNAFLQAAKFEVPIVSLQVDPGQMLSQHGCGLCCNGSLDQLQEKIYLLMTTPDLYNQISERSLAYVRAYHDKEKIISQYEDVLTTVLTSTPHEFGEYSTTGMAVSPGKIG